MIHVIFDKNVVKILTLISLSPGSRFRRNEIKEKTKINNIPLDNALLKLIKSKVLKKENNFYSLNFGNEISNQILKIISNYYVYLKKIPLNIYFLSLDIISELKLFKNCELYLFGSYSKLIYKDTSDVDFAVLITKNFKKNILNKLIRKLENKYQKHIELHFFEKNKFYRNKRDPLVKDIIKNGIKLF
ncbi:MAG: nucleotidyltransferase domain-containing protein [Nanoarchaeota archaeon]|nr:nucleotidyltransferase domain-containing protein [Nanoarchaeota archaeon]